MRKNEEEEKKHMKFRVKLMIIELWSKYLRNSNRSKLI